MQDPIILLISSFAALMVLMFLNIPLSIAMALVGISGFIAYGSGIGIVSLLPFRALDSFVLTALPLFIFMGEILLRCGASEMIYRGTSKLLSWMPGGLLHSNIGSCAMFAAVCGSSPATSATIGTVAIPSLKSRGYDSKLTLGSLAAGGTLGILIPPSINLIVYGMLAQASVGKLFAGGVFPGIILALMFMGYILTRCSINKSLAPQEGAFSMRSALHGMRDLWPLFVIAVIILGGIFGGFMTATEAAAIGCLTSLILALALRRFSWKMIQEALTGAMETTCMVLIIVVGASILGAFFARSGIPMAIAEGVKSLNLSTMQFVVLVMIVYFVIGEFMEELSLLIIMLPIILPMLAQHGVDKVWFGVIIVILQQIGMLTPPYGINLFVIQGISKTSLGHVVLGSIPFWTIMILGVALFVIFPEIILWLPGLGG